MTDKNILQKVIEKCNFEYPVLMHYPERKHQESIIEWRESSKITSLWIFDKSYYRIIFDHDFAKAFWGEEEKYISNISLIVNDIYNIKERIQLINEEEFINYFGKGTLTIFLNTGKVLLKNQIKKIEDIQKCFKQNVQYTEDNVFGTGWQYHLQQMILEEEPLKYLEKFL